MSMLMTRTFGRWQVAQAGELNYWQRPDTIERHSNLAARRDYWRPYVDFIGSGRAIEPGDALLDIGCGPTGIFTAIETEGRKVGLDPLIDEYRDHYPLSPGVEFLKCGGEQIDLPDASFEHVFCLNALDHCLEPQRVLEESFRVLKPGGQFTLAVDVYNSSARKWKALLSAHVKVRVFQKQELHPHKFVRKDVTAMLERVGLEPTADRALNSHRYILELVFLARKPEA
ncbi:MAG: methyltransferase domain-containing protein [Planctomycetota bacterium]